MFTPQHIVIICIFLQVGLTFWAIFSMGLQRVKSLKARETTLQDVALASDGYPDYVKPYQNNVKNQFETPVLLYALVLLSLASGIANWGVALGAALFIISRFIHRAVHVGANDLRLRFNVFLGGLIGLAIGWLALGLGLLGVI
ncbi:MAG: MAPEG family protein [Paracoccaceae bacterium]